MLFRSDTLFLSIDNKIQNQEFTLDPRYATKEELANISTGGTGGSSTLEPLRIVGMGQDSGQYLNVKTDIQLNDTFYGDVNGFKFYNASSKYILSGIFNLYKLNTPTGSTFDSFGNFTTYFTFYYSNDGYLCLACKNANFYFMYVLNLYNLMQNKKVEIISQDYSANPEYYKTN